MPPFILRFETLQQLASSGLWADLLVLGVRAWLVGVTVVAVRNWNTPGRLDKVEDIKTDIATMKNSVEHLTEQVNRVYDRIVNEPPRPEGPKPHPTIDPDK